MKKFELTAECVTSILGKKLFRIKALVATEIVKLAGATSTSRGRKKERNNECPVNRVGA